MGSRYFKVPLHFRCIGCINCPNSPIPLLEILQYVYASIENGALKTFYTLKKI